MTATPGTRLPSARRTCVIEKLLIRQQAAGFGSKRRDIFGGEVLTQRQIAEACRVSASTVNKLAFYIEDCQKAGLDPFDVAGPVEPRREATGASGRPGSRLTQAQQAGIVNDLLIRQQAAPLGSKRRDFYTHRDILPQKQIAEKWRVSTVTVNKMAIDLEERQKAGRDVFDFSGESEPNADG